jgi:hypothetical protein
MCLNRSLHGDGVREFVVPEALILGYFLPSRVVVIRPDGSTESSPALLYERSIYLYKIADPGLADEIDRLEVLPRIEWEEVLVEGMSIFKAMRMTLERV